MNVFEVLPDDDNWARSDIRGNHLWTLPGIDCPICGCWGSTSPSYPTVETPELKQSSRKTSWPVSLENYKRLAQSIAQRLSPTQIVDPGNEFGPFIGKAIGIVPDFSWKHSWVLFIKAERLPGLIEAGFKSPASLAPDLLFQKESANLLEFEIHPLASWDVSRLKKSFQCELCGLFRDGLPENKLPTVLRSSIPDHVDLFRVKQAPAIILCTESFKEMVTRLKLTNITFSKMKISG